MEEALQSELMTSRWNRVFNALSVEPRRRLVASLLEHSSDEAVALPDGATPVSSGGVEELEISLPHRHLPVLADSGYVRWEAEPFQASRGPRFEEVAAVLKLLSTNSQTLPDSLAVGCWDDDRRRSEPNRN